MKPPLKALFFCASLHGGGAETHLLRLLNRLDRERFRVMLAVAVPGGRFEAELAPDVDVVHLRRGRPWFTLPRLLGAALPLRRLLRWSRPDILCSILDPANVTALLAASGLESTRSVICVQNTVSVKYRRSRTLGRSLTHWLMRRLYPRADRIVASSEGVARDLVAWLPALEGRVAVAANAVVDESVAERARSPAPDAAVGEGPLIVACGRLTEQKGFSYLLRALSRVRESLPARLLILGEGEAREGLEAEIRELGLGGCVLLPGFADNPYRQMAAASVFVSSSLWEGFGNVIVEAMASGAPVVATDCPHGPGEIIRDGVDGLLVPPADSEALAGAILRLLESGDLASRLARQGALRAEAFSSAAAAARYEKLFSELSRRDEPAQTGLPALPDAGAL